MKFNLSLKKTLATAMALSTLSTVALADDIALGVPAYGGNGCPAGTASVALSDDQKTLTILFDDYFVEAGGRKRIARKTCNIGIPVHVPQGLTISLLEADYRGYVSLPRGAQARFSAEYFFAGQRGPKFVKSFRGYTDKDYVIQNKLGLSALVWSPCGEDVNLRVNSSMLVRTNRYKEDALATVDSADFKAGIKYKIQWKSCGSTSYNDDYGFYDDDWY